MGKVAIENGKVIGYLGFTEPFSGAFGNVEGVFSPLGASAFSGKDRGKLASMLYQEVSRDLIESGICSHAISFYAHDDEIGRSFVLNGFGIRCSDAIVELSKRKHMEMIPHSYEISRLPEEERELIGELRKGLVNHLADAPVFFPTDLSIFKPVDENSDTMHFVAREGEKILGYLSVEEDDAETIVSANPKMWNICGAYVLPEYRGQKIADGILEFICQEAQEKGMKYLGVDCETLNPTALHFWGKYFANYTYSYARRIDERIIGYQKYFQDSWKK